MYAYPSDAFDRASDLPDGMRLWLDLWHEMLHEGTHVYWMARPIGVSTIAAIAPAHRDKRVDARMRQQLKLELLEALSSASSILPIGPPVDPLEINFGDWPSAWLGWLDGVSGLQAEIRSRAEKRLTASIAADDYDEICRWTGIAVQEALARDPLQRQLFRRARSFFLGGVEEKANWSRPRTQEEWGRRLDEFFRPAEERQFNCKIPLLTGQSMSKKMVKWASMPIHGVNFLEEDSGYALSSTEESDSADAAAEMARKRAVQRLTDFRVHWPARSFALGDEIHLSSDGDDLAPIPLPSPFVKPAAGTRGTPEFFLPRVREKLDEPDGERWQNCRIALAQAFAVWPDNVGLAATLVWTSLESLTQAHSSERYEEVLEKVAAPFYARLTKGLIQDIAFYVQRQSWEFEHAGVDATWRYWHPDHPSQSAEEWFNDITTERGQWFYRRWHPAVPSLLIRRLQEIRDLQKDLSSAKERTKADLTLLYGLRNASVHKSDLAVHESLAAYLGRVGLMVLLAVSDAIDQEASTIQEGEDRKIKIDELLKSQSQI